MRKEGPIAFDLDGTLLDSRERHEVVLSDCLREEGLPPITSDFVAFKANGFSGLRYLNEKGIERETARQIYSKWIERIEDDAYLERDKLYEDAIITLNALRGRFLILVTARARPDAVRRQIIRIGIEPYFARVFIVTPGSAAHEAKASALRHLSPSCIIGDTESEAKCANLLNIPAYLLNRGFRNEQYWSKRHINSYPTLYDIVRLLNST